MPPQQPIQPNIPQPMMPKNNKNPIIIILLIILIALVAYFAFFKKDTSDSAMMNDATTMFPSDQTQDNQTPTGTMTTPTTQTQTNQNPTVADYQPNQAPVQSITWIKSSKFGLYYPQGFTVSESAYLTPAQQEQGAPESEGAPEFSATDGNAIISWGGHQSYCGQTQYGVFTKGVSVVTCLNGITTRIGVNNVRNTITQEELNLFGEFVLKNQ
jgi:hypothetical protein